MQYLSRHTLKNDWLDVFEMSSPDPAIVRVQNGVDLIGNRLDEYRKITSDCLVISFEDDLVVPPLFGREIAEDIPGSRYQEVPGCGHYGYLEQPDVINELIIGFFQRSVS